MRLIPFCIAALVGLSACETLVDVDLPEHESRLVVNGLFLADSLWSVNVSESVSVLSEASPRAVPGATIVVLEGGVPVDTLVPVGPPPREDLALFYPTHRSLSHRPESGTMYTLRVSAPGYEPVEATSFAPEAVPFTLEAAGTSGSSEEELTIRFTDPAGAPNYYKLEVLLETTYPNDPDFPPYVQPVRFQTATSLLVEGELVDVIDDGNTPTFWGPAYFSGEPIDGQTYTIEAKLQHFVSHEMPNVRMRRYVRLTTLSREYYLFGRSLRAEQQDNVFSEIEPVRIYSNVENGMGIFAGSSAYTQEIEPGAEGPLKE